MPLIRPGLVARADPGIGLIPPRAHPCIIIKVHPNGNAVMAYISHSADLYLKHAPLTRWMAAAAFAPDGPLTDDLGVIGLVGLDGIPAAHLVLPHRDGVMMGSAVVRLTRAVQLPPDQWERVRSAIALMMK